MKRQSVYKASKGFVGAFYFLLLAWTVVSIYFLGQKTINAGWPLGQLLMIGFVLAYTWYFSLNISYQLIVSPDGMIRLISFRKIRKVDVKDISKVEGPRFALLSYSFIRFTLEREKAYLFCHVTDQNLQKALSSMRDVRPTLEFKGI